MIALDTNLLVYAFRSRVAEHKAARAVIGRAAADPRGWGYALPSVSEFWAVVTHPEAAGGPANPKDAASFLEALGTSGAKVWWPRPDFSVRLVRLAAHLAVTGSRVFDLEVALTAFEGGATELWTHDRYFVQLPGLLVKHPLAAARR